MSDRIVMNALYLKDGKASSPQVKHSREMFKNISGAEMYIHDAFVSLYSAKVHGGCRAALVTNTPLSDEYAELFGRNGIEVLVTPFDNFRVPDDWSWGYAFYKLCALEYVVRTQNFKSCLMLDTDTVSARSYKDIWKELGYSGILLYNTGHDYSHQVRASIRNDYQYLFGQKKNIPQYGGELIGGSRESLDNLVKECNRVYEQIKSKNFSISAGSGDEAILSMAAETMPVMDASPYIQRFWTRGFYLSSNKWENEAVAIWHLPAEKAVGLEKIYGFIRKHGSLPPVREMASWCNLPEKKMKLNAAWIEAYLKNLR